jgi:hypothetical protein
MVSLDADNLGRFQPPARRHVADRQHLLGD